jgi:hypothetical protein
MEFLKTSPILLFGVGFIVLGRWLYKNPRKLFRLGFLNPEHPEVQKLARMYATFLIFFGMFASVGIASAFLFRSVPGMPLIALVVSMAGAWLLRPKIPQPETPVPTIDNARNPALLGKHWKRNLAIFAGLMGLLVIVIVVTLRDSDVCKLAFAKAETNPTVKQRLGEPVKRGFFISGTIQISGPSGHADIEIPVSGPKGKATVYAVAQKSAGLWKFEILQIAFEEASPRVNLLNQETGLSTP